VVKRKPDLIVILLAVFGLGVLATLLLPISSSPTVAEPASPLQAGIIADSGNESAFSAFN
jgi:hypothetical protein